MATANEYLWFADTIRTLSLWVGLSALGLIVLLLLLMLVMWHRSKSRDRVDGREVFGRPEPDAGRHARKDGGTAETEWPTEDEFPTQRILIPRHGRHAAERVDRVQSAA